MKYYYSPNMMGPMNHWYEKNGIPYVWEEYTWDGETKKIKHYDQYAGGRIDISCATCQWEEIGAPIMTARDWNKLHDFCDEFESNEKLGEIEFFDEFELWLGRPISWGPGEWKWLEEMRA